MLSRKPQPDPSDRPEPSAPSAAAMFRKQCCSECGTVMDSGDSTLIRGDLTLDRALRRTTWKGRNVQLSNQQFAILEMLVCREGRVVQLWAFYVSVLNEDTDGNVLHVQLCRMRKAFRAVDPQFDHIETVRNRGLMWRRTPAAPAPAATRNRVTESINS